MVSRCTCIPSFLWMQWRVVIFLRVHSIFFRLCLLVYIVIGSILSFGCVWSCLVFEIEGHGWAVGFGFRKLYFGGLFFSSVYSSVLFCDIPSSLSFSCNCYRFPVLFIAHVSVECFPVPLEDVQYLQCFFLCLIWCNYVVWLKVYCCHKNLLNLVSNCLFSIS